jgi:hypothetical protein
MCQTQELPSVHLPGSKNLLWMLLIEAATIQVLLQGLDPTSQDREA